MTGDRDSERVVAVRGSSTAMQGEWLFFYKIFSLSKEIASGRTFSSNLTYHCSRSGEIEGTWSSI